MATRNVNCKEVARRLQSYLDGELNEDRMEQIRAHLDDCVSCGLEFETFKKIKMGLNAQALPSDSDALARLRAFSERISTEAANS